MTKSYRTIDEITDIFGITLPIAKKIIKKHKVDTFTSKGYKVHIKDFYKAYTLHYNPSLFDVRLPKSKKKSRDISYIFQQLFGCAYKTHQ